MVQVGSWFQIIGRGNNRSIVTLSICSMEMEILIIMASSNSLEGMKFVRTLEKRKIKHIWKRGRMVKEADNLFNLQKDGHREKLRSKVHGTCSSLCLAYFNTRQSPKEEDLQDTYLSVFITRSECMIWRLGSQKAPANLVQLGILLSTRDSGVNA